jgi:hypothetical protein
MNNFIQLDLFYDDEAYTCSCENCTSENCTKSTCACYTSIHYCKFCKTDLFKGETPCWKCGTEDPTEEPIENTAEII